MYGHPSHLNPYGYPERGKLRIHARKGAAILAALAGMAFVAVPWWVGAVELVGRWL